MPETSKTCSVSRSALLSLIDTIVYMLGSGEYCAVADDEHYRRLVSNQVEAVFTLAAEIDFDLWEEVAAPVGREDTPIAVLLREANAAFGMTMGCLAGCDAPLIRCGRRPRSLPRGTLWPTCPELCERHTALRLAVFVARVEHTLPAREGPIHSAGMPLPDLVEFAPSTEELEAIATS